MVKVVNVYELDDGESTDSSIDLDQTQNVSMAASAAYIPGASLSDKLRLAASKGQADKVQELINAGATFEPDREGRTALHYAALNGHGEIIQILSDEGADINSQDTLGYTALHRAAAQGHLEVIKVLLCEGCLVNRQDEVHGNSPLHEASWNGYSKTLELLIRQKANVHCINKAGFSALHLAAQNGHNQSARVLLYAGCNPDMKNNYGDTALHTAARYGHAGVTRILISARCNIDEQNKNGDSALHISSALKRRKLAKLLTECGISVTLKNKQGETALDVARRKNHSDIITTIMSQPPKSKKGKKSKDKKKDKASKGEETTEKRGFFFKKKSKKEKEKVVVEVPPRVVDNPQSQYAASEASSSEYNHMPPPELLQGFRQSAATRPRDRSASARGTSTRSHKPVGQKQPINGLLTDYAPKHGTQLYKDLAGNVKKGPIGYAPVCNCQPVIKKLEKKMEHDKHNMYDHIETYHKNVNTRIDDMDKRSSAQVYNIEKLTRERHEQERHDREEYVQSCIRKNQMEIQDTCETRHTNMKTDLVGHMDNRFSNFERYYGTTLSRKVPQPEEENYGQPRYHQDDMLNKKYMYYDAEEPPMPGKLYKSKSDESLASSHHSRKHWKLQSQQAVTARDIRDMKLAQVHDRARRMERKIRARSAGVRASNEQLNRPRDTSEPVSRHTGRTPEGQSTSNLHGSQYQSYKDYVQQQHEWNARRAPVNTDTKQMFPEPSSQRQDPASRGQSQGHASRSQQPPPPPVRRQRSSSQNNDNRQSLAQVNGHSQGQLNHYGTLPRQNSNHSQDGAATRQPYELKQATSAHNLNGNHENNRQQFDGNNHRMPHSASYDHSTSQQHLQQQQQQNGQHHLQQQQQQQRFYQQQPSSLPPPQQQARLRPEPQRPAPTPAQQPSSQAPVTPAPQPQRWTPLQTSSPDGHYGTPNTSNSLMSSQNSTPLYPSPAPGLKPQKSESDSNPDSGYGSRFFRGRQISEPQLAESTSSFQSSHGHDTTNSSARTDGFSPVAQIERESRRQVDHHMYRSMPQGQRPQPQGQRPQSQAQPRSLSQTRLQPQQQYSTVPEIVNRWYDPNRQTQHSQQDVNRMWPPARSNGQGQRHDDLSGAIGKATQV